MSAAEQIDVAAEELKSLQSKQGEAANKPQARQLTPDQAWARKNLRFRDGRAYLDVANVLRVLERHSDYNTRFKFNEMLAKVMDKGTVMLDWKVAELTADLQERFLPAVEQEIVNAALVVAANRGGAKPA